MSGNDSNKLSARGRVEFRGASPEADEAIAAVAAIERFVAETAPAPTQRPTRNPWQQAALIEGVSAKRSAFPADPGTGFPLR